MSRLRVFAEEDPVRPLRVTDDGGEIARQLAAIGVRFERWTPRVPVAPGDPPEAVMAAYREDIDRLVRERGFRTVDVVSVHPEHPAREELRRKFLDEHYHREDEVRFFVAGSGLFTLHPDHRVYEVLCEAGDLIAVPDRMRHWFDMGPRPSFVAIRFFTEPDGWVGHFTGSGIAARFPRFEPEAA
ncbi:MAG: acireductone dioxygenase [Xanthomonadales bacterium]|nr:acireductone dioxygenase [Xanthomonadales bacterium]